MSPRSSVSQQFPGSTKEPDTNAMTLRRNVGVLDRSLRAMGAAASLACAVWAPLSLTVRLVVFGATGIYLLLSALAGSCVGYTLLWRSTCPRDSSSA